MIKLRHAGERGHFHLGWLETFHSFSFGDYFDAKHMGFRFLRVINEDRVEPGQGFPTHAHQDMEIVTYVLSGALEHKDSLGNGSQIRPGDVQRMSAGRGVRHSEYNPSAIEKTHLLQIWILPAKPGGDPGYEQKTFSDDQKRGRFCLIGSSDGREGSVTIHQDVMLYAGLLSPGESLSYGLKNGRGAWLQLAKGSLSLNGQILNVSDGAAIENEAMLDIRTTETCEFLLFDMA